MRTESTAARLAAMVVSLWSWPSSKTDANGKARCYGLYYSRRDEKVSRSAFGLNRVAQYSENLGLICIV